MKLINNDLFLPKICISNIFMSYLHHLNYFDIYKHYSITQIYNMRDSKKLPQSPTIWEIPAITNWDLIGQVMIFKHN